MVRWLAALNTLAALSSAGFGVAALLRPGLIAPSGQDTSSRFYPAMYAARAIPLGLAVAVAVWLTPAPTFLVLLLVAAIVAQLGDIAIGVAYRVPGMIAGPVIAVLCHGAAVVVTAW
ncbi:hypothetical protein [Cellulomonas denverensis]|uniref:DUF4267 domain-containing protein n=1 Tax=Cellulomonas denverensis TaxID=264297 RepID=A0A7X6R0J4_9CELL|nr:hypothetical protein [Cellulomonas denverensis]NKY24217.1 hypothetical protein [Cellulomonas denverensis]GIG24867.1 hypothetical protein Cde04nite_11110 [Cellulomonas denverensis]